MSNQVYEFLNRMGVKGILPLYSNAMLPLSRREVADDLIAIGKKRDELAPAEVSFLEKFEREFSHEIDPSKADDAVLFKSTDGIFSDKEKYLYEYADSGASLFMEFLGALDYRAISGDSYGSTSDSRGSTHASFEQHGGRVRGTVKNYLGYYLQATNGTLYGDRAFALTDPFLRGSVKLDNLGSPYFDFTEAYLRADVDWFNIEFGREYTLIGTGYSDRLLLSQNAPVIDFLKIDARYKSLRFLFLQGSLTGDSTVAPGIPNQAPPGSNKYLALHRVQVSLFDRINVGASEMIIYQRFSPDFAYLNPVNFYKSAEHSLRDRDNAFLNFDLEVYPHDGWKLYGTWLIDDIDFSRFGTGWWGNEFGWQGGIFASGLAGMNNLDAVVEYTRLEPYVYSNRLAGNDYTNDNIGLGHHLQPNSDEWFLQLQYRPCSSLRTWLTYTRTRHGGNEILNGVLVRNVGGDILQGHRDVDSQTATFLDGLLTTGNTVQARASYEPITNFILTGIYEHRRAETFGVTAVDNYASLHLQIEY